MIGLRSRLPEDTPLVEIAREIELLAGLRVAREQARGREGIAAEDARKLVEGWGWPVVLTPQSQGDLREIVTFIARDSPEHALGPFTKRTRSSIRYCVPEPGHSI